MGLFSWLRGDVETETRSDTLADAVAELLVARASGQSTASWTESGAVEVAAGLVSRCFASVRIRNVRPIVESALHPGFLSVLGRALIRHGEMVSLLDVRRGQLRLFPVSAWSVTGGYRPESWTYQLTVNGPSESHALHVGSARVVHARVNADTFDPWAGRSPLQHAKTAARLNAEVNNVLADETSGPRGHVLPIAKPVGDDTLDTVAATLKGLKGGLTLMESQASWADKHAAPANEWQPERIGANPPATLVDLRRDADALALVACGVPVGLLHQADGASLRESYRLLLQGTLVPLGRLCEVELRDKLDSPSLTFDWSDLRASDLQGRARAFASLVGGGMDQQRASGLVGFDA